MNFSFVAYDGPKVPLDPSVRRTIRRQAMRDTAAEWKQNGGYRKHNLGQCPIFLEGNNQTKDFLQVGKSLPEIAPSSRTGDQIPSNRDMPTKSKQWQSQHAAVSCHYASSPPIPILYPELVAAKRFSSLLHLTPLTWPRLGIPQFAGGPDGFTTPLSTQHFGSRKLLSFILSRYGHVPSLNHATDCVVAKLQQIMQPPDNRPAGREANVLMHYSKVLRALQAALDDEAQRTTTETLCATELLGFFEVRTYSCLIILQPLNFTAPNKRLSFVQLLNGGREARSWVRHAGGAAQLIQARGAHRFETEFEMALFSAHIGPTVGLLNFYCSVKKLISALTI